MNLLVEGSLASVPYNSTFILKAVVLFALSSNKRKSFCKYHNHKTIEILCSESKNLKTK